MRAGYAGASTYSVASGSLDLQTALGATPAGLVDHPDLFSGVLARPDVAAAGILAVADVAAARYADAGLAKRLANLDPVVTVSGDRLRFESFSACNGVQARFDLLADGIDSGDAKFGTTNVDINQPLRSALAQVGRADLLHLAVGSEEIRMSTMRDSHVERQVPLPDRWVRGFGETPLLAARTEHFASFAGAALVAKVFASLPKVSPPGPDLHLVATPRGLAPRLSAGPATLSVPGGSRMRGAARIVRFATGLSIFRGDTGSTGWVFDLPGARFSLLLSPEPYRGFSGEGSLLTLIAQPRAEEIGRDLALRLAWQPVIDPSSLAARRDTSRRDIDGGLAWLAASGRVGYDLAESTWFHRELPIDAEAVQRRNPRLVEARRILAGGAVDGTSDPWTVHGDHGTYTVRRDEDRYTCTCRWEWKHRGTRGPCKHVLAVIIGQLPAAARA